MRQCKPLVNQARSVAGGAPEPCTLPSNSRVAARSSVFFAYTPCAPTPSVYRRQQEQPERGHGLGSA